MNNKIVILLILIFNFILILLSIQSGIKKGDISLRFQERQAVTFFSALFLGVTGLISLLIYYLKKKKEPQNRKKLFWLLSGLGFLYLCLDDYFMMHEGLDKIIFSFFKPKVEILDSFVLSLFGLIAFLICIIYIREILKQKEIIIYLVLGSLCFIFMVISDFIFNFGLFSNTLMIVIEESFKILGVSFFMAGYLRVFFNYLNKFI